MSISVDYLTVGYNKKPLIEDISFSVQPGEILCLIGPNGSGKSTILKTLVMQLQKIKGKVLLLDEDTDKLSNSEVAQKLSMVMTERVKTELMTCRDIVATGRYPYTGKLGILSEQDWEKVDEAMTLVGADETFSLDFSKVSDGQRQRVMLARALCQEPDVLVLDEPTSFLDMRFKIEILDHIRKLAKMRNFAVVMSLHELDLAQKIADQILCVKGDRIDKMGTPAEVFSGAYIQKLYGIKEECFDIASASLYFEGNKSFPQVFVIGGGGFGIPYYLELQKRDIPFACGVIGKGDVEYGMARACASQLIACEAFAAIEDVQVKMAREWIEKSQFCLCAIKNFGPLNQRNKELLDYAKQLNKLIEMEQLWQKL